MARSDLLKYLQRYHNTARRRLGRVERWRRRHVRRGQIARAAEALAADLHARGVSDGERVGVWVQDGPLFAAALFGVLRAGGVAVPVDATYPPARVTRITARLELAAWVADAELPALELDVDLPSIELRWRILVAARPTVALPWPADDPQRPALVVLTSGTADEPQSVELSHANLLTVLDSLEHEIARYRWLIRLAPRVRLAVALPLSHLYGQYMGVLLPVLLGADVAVLDNMPASEIAAALRRERAWALASVPHTLSSLLGFLLDRGREMWGDDGLQERLRRAEGTPWLRRLRAFAPLRRLLGRRMVAMVSGGAALDSEVERTWKLLGYVVIQGYGLTEAAPLVTLNNPFHARAGSVGTPLPGVEVQLADDGEILVRGGNVATPSARGPQIDADGWLHTGDFGELLDDGAIRFRGRRSDRIVTPAGVNVDPGEVSAVLCAFPEVIDAVAVERPWGDPGTICAVLAVYPGADVDAVVRAANRRLADAARVRSWFVWPHGDLPRTSTGKVRRRDVLAWLAGHAPSHAGTLIGDARSEETASPSRIDQLIAALTSPGNAAPSAANGASSDPDGAAGHPGADRPSDDALINDLLSSLERVELVARLEDLYGIAAGDELFRRELTVATLRSAIREALGTGTARASPPTVELRAPGEQPASADAEPSATPSAHPRPTARHTMRRAGIASASGPDPASWRFRRSTRLARLLLREGLMHPLARMLLRIEAESTTPLSDLPAPFLLAANHASFIDPLVMFALPARRRALAPAARWNFFTDRPGGRRLYSWGVLFLDLFPLVQSGDWRPTLRVAGRLADAGSSILIYPEGEISRDGELHTFYQGVAVMSRELHLPIVPCGTAGIERVLPPDSRRIRRSSWKRPRVAVCFGDPLPPVRPGESLDARTDQLRGRVRALRERARAMVR